MSRPRPLPFLLALAFTASVATAEEFRLSSRNILADSDRELLEVATRVVVQSAGSTWLRPVFEDLVSLYRTERGASSPADIAYHSMAPRSAECRFQDHATHCSAGDDALPTEGFTLLVTEKPYEPSDMDHMVFPLFTAPLAVVYNLPELDGQRHTLRLDLATLGRIFSGEITHWRHPAIMQLNTDLADALPEQDILVVAHGESSGENYVLKSSLKESFFPYEEQLADGSLEEGGSAGWPARNGTFAFQATGAAAAYAVRTSPFSIGYVAYRSAVIFELQQALMYNGIKYTSIASEYLASLAPSKLQTIDHDNDLNWPISGSVQAVLRNGNPVQGLTCSNLKEAALFVLWFKASGTVDGVLGDHAFLPLLPLERNELKKSLLQMQCEGQPLASMDELVGAARPGVALSHAMPSIVAYMNRQYRHYELTEPGAQVTSYVDYNGEPCSAPVLPEVGFQVSMCGWSAGPPEQGVLIPVTLGAVAVKANLPGSGVQSLMMDVDTLAEIVTRDISRWDDQRLRTLNPELEPLDEDINLLLISDLLAVLQELLPSTASIALNYNTSGSGSGSAHVVMAEFLATPFSVVFTMDTFPALGAAPAAVPVKVVPKDGDGALSPTSDSMKNCLTEDGFGVDSLRPGCYPLTVLVQALLRSNHNNDQSFNAVEEVKLWRWLVQRHPSALETSDTMLPVYEAASAAARDSIAARLHSVTFHNGTSVLGSLTPPPPGSQRSVAIAVIVGSGCLLLLLVLMMVYMYQRSQRALRRIHHSSKTTNDGTWGEEEIDVEAPVIKIMKFLEGIANSNSGSNKNQDQAAELLKLLHHSNNLQAPDIYSEVDKLQSRHATDGAIGNYLVELAMPNARRSTLLEPRSIQSSAAHIPVLGDGPAFGRSMSTTYSGPQAELFAGDDTAGLLKSLAEILGANAAISAKKLADIIKPLGDSMFCNVTLLPKLTKNRPLSVVFMGIAHSSGLIQALQLKRAQLVAYIMAIEDGYNANPYHNRAHAADVVARSYAVLKRLGMSNKVESKLQQLAMLVAAAAHDTEHPGFNNTFMVRHEGVLARRYNDQAVLENHSLHMSLELIRDPGMNFLEGSQIANGHYWRMFKSHVISMVLATDMSNHFEIVSKFKQKFAALKYSQDPSEFEEDGSMMGVLLQMSIKSADIGHCATRMQQHLFWSRVLQDEFFNQGDMEKRNQMEVSAMMDRDKPGCLTPANQVGFFEVIVLPMYKAMVDHFPMTGPLYEQALVNYNYWKLHIQPDRHFVGQAASEYMAEMQALFASQDGATLDGPLTESDHLGASVTVSARQISVTGNPPPSSSQTLGNHRASASDRSTLLGRGGAGR